MRVTPDRLRKHLNRWQVPYTLVKGWDSPYIDPYKGRSDFVGILLHHTAGTDSLAYCVRGTYPPVRNCHFLIERDGLVDVVSGVGAYHAGEGGPWAITRRVVVPKDQGNQHLYGIEIESLGTSSRISGKPEGMTVDQVVSTALLCAALLDAMAPGPLIYRVGRVSLHRIWAPKRKIDVRQDLDWWANAIRIARHHRFNKRAVAAAIRGFVAAYPDGHID